MNLEKTTDPECPKCGCTQSDVINERPRWGQPRKRRECANCGALWNEITQQPASRLIRAPEGKPRTADVSV